MSDWFADEALWTDLYSFLFAQERFEKAQDQIEKLIRLVEFSGTRVLDLPCGPGTHAVPLAALGYRTTGVDLSAFLLERARARADDAEVEVEWIREDMRDFCRPDTFDLATNLFSSLGFFDDQEDNQRVLQNLCRSLRPGGVCVLDMTGKEWVARMMPETMAHDLVDGGLLVERNEICDDWSRIRHEWIVLRGEDTTTFRFEHAIYSGQELKDRLRAAGFSAVRLFGDLDGNPYDLSASRLVAAAWK
ncbi:MAG: class I SAM-dependent methyltransferase [bacterium]|nr:class I SAM-dependent methyltransferase [bacterium]